MSVIHCQKGLSCVRGLVASITLMMLLAVCQPKESIHRPADAFGALDSVLRHQPFEFESMLSQLRVLSENLPHSETRETSYDAWRTKVNYRWNADSSLVMIQAYKGVPKGFSREVMVHAGDSILFVYRFSTTPLAIENREDHTFLEVIRYLRPNGTLMHLSRIAYDQKDLADTTSFFQQPLYDLTDNIHHFYSMELNHGRNILVE